jgi:COP9 signalosome complex subunit 2
MIRALSVAYTERCDKRLSAKTNLKLAKLWLDRGEFARLSKVGPHVPARLT